MKIAIVGLGKMGAQIAKRLIEHQHDVIAVDPNAAAVQAAADLGAMAVGSRSEAVAKFGDEQVVVWLMIPAQFVTGEVEEWLKVLPAGSLLIDGGNTDYRQTKRHAKAATDKDIRFVDIGVSGGVLGTTNGFSMMVGGDEQSYEFVKPILDALAQPRGGHEYFGEVGSGHFVKMVHNAIEYGMMESLAEGYEILHEGPFKNLDLAKAGRVWQKASVIESTLNGLAADVMAEDQSLSAASGYVAESGEARWTLEAAKESDLELPVIKASLDVRFASEQGKVNYATKLLAELRNKFGGHNINK